MLYYIYELEAPSTLGVSQTSGGAAERLACDFSADGKLQLGRRASMFLEDASSLNRGSTFSTICQGCSRWTKQWSSQSRTDSGRGPPLGSSTPAISLIQVSLFI